MRKFSKYSKYHSKKVEICKNCGLDSCNCFEPVIFDSKKEADYYRQLLLLQKAGEVEEIQLQPKFTLQEGFSKNGKKHRAITYTADFMVIYKNGRREVVDVKGMRTQVFNLKLKLFEKKFPDLKVTII